MERKACAGQFSYRPAGSKVGLSKQWRHKRRYHVVLQRDAAKRLLGKRRLEEKKRLLAVAGLLLHPDDARRVAQNLPV